MSVREPVFYHQRTELEIFVDNLCFPGFYGEPRGLRSRMTPTSSDTKWRRELQAYGRNLRFRQTIRQRSLVLIISLLPLDTRCIWCLEYRASRKTACSSPAYSLTVPDTTIELAHFLPFFPMLCGFADAFGR
jgi:hypothetical protein